MLVRAIKNNEDMSKRAWVFCRGLSAYKKDQAGISQGIKSGLLEFQNDCYFALQNGIDWLTRLGSKNQKELLDNDIQNIISNRWGVLNIQDFQSSVIERAYSCSCNVYTVFSPDSYQFNFTQNI